jgi:hypothetical protein
MCVYDAVLSLLPVIHYPLATTQTERNCACAALLWAHVQAWEVLDPPSGWDVSGPVLATGYYHVSATVLQLVMMMDDALAHACHQGEQQAVAAGQDSVGCYAVEQVV